MRIALLGCGQAARMHSKTLARVAPDVERAYASRDGARARDYQARFGGVAAFDSYDAAIADPAVDVVLVASPPPTHLPLTLQALAAGKHVIVEKPPFLRSVDFDPVIAAEAASGRRVFYAENYYYKPLARRLRVLLAEGALGDVRFLHVNALKRQQVEDWRADPAIAGGGALFEGGIHWINFIANLGLEVVRVRGFRPGSAGEGPERSMLVVVEYANGAIGTLSYSWEIHSPLQGVRMSRIYGTHGTIAFESNGVFIASTGRRRGLSLPGLRDIAGYGAMFRDFIGALREDRAPELTTACARRDLEIIEEAYRTADRTESTA
jgi:predicted dehydrogenase